ncbi:TIR domain-containing protein [Caballeronia novacaledonica]|uniref:TIR domain-containing protein n=1 Tax=Caballeronia novacaledonica TaxID=1544861 RepID=A0ACB5QTM6_9BURK|nr:TIR domain-containing protein [Caballeronia novacaledonica]
MSRIFLSHSSKDIGSAVALKAWLEDQGWDDVFLDTDPERGIAAGERWERALHQAAQRSEAVLFLVSRAWINSDWCLREYHLAARMNKRLFGVLIEEIALSEIPPTVTRTWQLVSLASGHDHVMLSAPLPYTQEEVHVTFSQEGLNRLKIGLERAGLDARFFAWPPENDIRRAPYRGLLPLEGADAGIFFGREAPTIEALDRIRGIRDGAGPRLLVILGASGAGKSSFLRAGLLPRLARDDRNYLPLPIIRPERAAINGDAGLLRSLESAFLARGPGQARAVLRRAIAGGANTLRPLLRELVARASDAAAIDDASARRPMLVLALDQAEELFVVDGGEESGQLLALLRELMMIDDPPLLVLVTVRSDAYGQLQNAREWEGINQLTQSLTPMPRGAYQLVIEGPAARLKESSRPLRLEPALTEALLSDIDQGGGHDALPLLSFTLERLYLEYGASGRLELADYQTLGRIGGAIEAAVERAFAAADADPTIPRERQVRLRLLRLGLIPWLAGIDSDTGQPRRQTARMADLPEEARPLISLLVEERLLATDVHPETCERIVEPAHEALLRQWSVLRRWLQEDFAALTTLESIRRAARDWDASGRSEGWLAHRAARLEDAHVLLLRGDLAARLDATDRDYLASCRDREETERREREAARAREEAERQGKLRALQQTTMAVGERLKAESERADALKKEAEARKRSAMLSKWFGIAAGIVAIIMAGIGLYAEDESNSAHTSATLARENQKTAEHQRANVLSQLAAIEYPRGNEDGALRYSVSGTRLDLRSAKQSDSLPKQTDSSSKQTDSPSYATAQLASILANGSLRLTLGSQREDSMIFFANFSPDGNRVITASWDNTARIWDVRTRRELSELKGHQGRVFNAVFSPDGKRIVTTSEDKTARIWDAATGRELYKLAKQEKTVLGAAFSPNGKLIVTTSFDNTMRIWDADTGQELRKLTEGDETIYAASFSPDGTRIVTTSSARVARVWDVATGNQLGALRGHTDEVYDAVFSHDGRLIVTASEDNTARIWSAATGQLMKTLTGHSAGVYSATFSPDGKYVVTASIDNTARIWDLAPHGKTKVLKHTDEVESADFSFDGKWVVTASDDNTARVWNAANGQLIAKLGHDVQVGSADFSPDGQQVVTTSWDNTARIWDATLENPPLRREIRTLRGHRDLVNSAAFSVDGKFIVTASEDKTARIWNAADGVEIGVTMQHPAGVSSAVFDRDGKLILTTSADGTARVWDIRTGQPTASPGDYHATVTSALFNPEGTRFVTAANDGTVRVWNVATGDEIVSARRTIAGVNFAAYSADGSRMVTGSEDGIARIWSTAGGDQPVELKGHHGAIIFAAFNKDGTQVATASKDNTARLWDAATGKEIGKPMGHWDQVNTVSFSRNGRLLVTASKDNTARIWAASPEQASVRLQEEGSVASDAADKYVMRTVAEPMDTTGCIRQPAVEKSGTESNNDRDPVAFAAFDQDGKRVVTAWGDATPRIWDAVTGKLIRALKGHQGTVLTVAFSKDGTRVLTASKDDTVRAWDVATGNEIPGFRLCQPGVTFAAYSPDGRLIVIAAKDGTGRVLTADGKDVRPLKTPRSAIMSAFFSKDGHRIVTASADNIARFWDVDKGDMITELKEFPGGLTFAALSPKGDLVVTASANGRERIWDAETGHEKAELKDHPGPVSSAVFSPDGTRIVTTTPSDNIVRIWDVATGSEIEEIDGHQDGIRYAVFGPDPLQADKNGTRIVVASGNHSARIWDVRFATMQPQDLVNQACQHQLVAVPRLSREDMRRFAYPDAEPEHDVCNFEP